MTKLPEAQAAALLDGEEEEGPGGRVNRPGPPFENRFENTGGKPGAASYGAALIQIVDKGKFVTQKA